MSKTHDYFKSRKLKVQSNIKELASQLKDAQKELLIIDDILREYDNNENIKNNECQR